MKTINAIVALVALVGCAVGPVNTPSGNPEVTIKSTDTQRIKNAVVRMYSATGYRLVQDTQFNLEFVKQLDFGEAALYTVAMGNAYSSLPNLRIAVTIVPSESATRVFAHVGVEMQGGLGQNQGTNLDHGKAGKQIQASLEQLKTAIEGGRGAGARETRVTRAQPQQSSARQVPSSSPTPQHEEEIQNPNVSPQ
jgi:hypothetical protein